MERLEEIKKKPKEDLGDWEEVIFGLACDLARTLAKEVLEELDNELMQERDDSMKVVAYKEHWVTTLFCDIRLKRRLYRDKKGNYHFPLDKKM